MLTIFQGTKRAARPALPPPVAEARDRRRRAREPRPRRAGLFQSRLNEVLVVSLSGSGRIALC